MNKSIQKIFRGLTTDNFCAHYFALTSDGKAFDSNGDHLLPECHEAVKWCAIGWLIRWCKLDGEPLDYPLSVMHKKATKLGYDTIADANDAMGYAYIKELQR